MTPALSVVIPCLKSGPSLERILRSLQRVKAPAHEILIIFNLPDLEGEILAANYGARCYTVGSIGTNKARNLGIEKSSGEVILFVDDDCELDDVDLLEKHARLHQLHPDILAFGGIYDLPIDHSQVQAVYNHLALDWITQAQAEDGFNLDLLGGHVSYKRRLLPRGMKFDPTIVFGGAETEFHLRLRRAGHKLLLMTDLRILHHSQSDLFSLMRKGFCQGRTFAQLPFSFSHSRHAPSVRKRKANECLISGLYAYAFHLGASRSGRTPSSWLEFAYYIGADVFKRLSDKAKTLINAKPITSLHILLRLTLIPRPLKGDRR